jgi:hypothetical protein
VFANVEKTMESPMATQEFLQDLTDDEAQSIQGGAANERTDLSINIFGIRLQPIQLTGTPFGGAVADVLIRVLGTNTVPLTPAGSPVSLAFIFTGSGAVLGGRR